MTEEVLFRDFSRKRPRVEFGIDGVVYECVKALGTASLQDLMRLYRGNEMQSALKASDPDRIMAFLRDIFKIFIIEASFEKFIEKLEDREDPIDVRQLLEIVAWVVEVYTKDPSALSENSSDGSSSVDVGITSQVGAQPEISTLVSLTQDVS